MAFTVADYILKRLSEQHVDTLFGVPAAYCAPLFDAAPAHGLQSVVNASDLEAGYAADAYARTHGLGAVSVAYGVGALSMINAIAGAYVERSRGADRGDGRSARPARGAAVILVIAVPRRSDHGREFHGTSASRRRILALRGAAI